MSLTVPVPTIKSGVDLSALQPPMTIAFFIACAVFAAHGYGCTLTGGREGKHGRGSLHYVGLAEDLRTRHLASMAVARQIADELRAALGDQYDVVLEGKTLKDSHLHVEFQPK